MVPHAGTAVAAALLLAVTSGTEIAAAIPPVPVVGECVPGADALCDMPHPIDPIHVTRSLELSVVPVGPFSSKMRATASVTNEPKAPFSAEGETVTFTIDGRAYTAVVGADETASVDFHPRPGGGFVGADLPMGSESDGLIIMSEAHAEVPYTAPAVGIGGGFLGWLLSLLHGIFGF
ncbi:hypothetical protein [Corynebacterium sp. TAE3-ERU16]|uniref:hypothetical protein n=1 Tax=Corynebacterium sp. TAE3-ERU16 TaxID=2849493 RepID=UPI001C459991|nr:hypothetical protein [Corynebacterium sp. TAE3-ERU16]MBV7293426.1 hypothetical protein [Corynebacterium sp. TAE3-ERU16]